MEAIKNNNVSFWLGGYIILVVISLNALGPYFKVQSMVTFGMLPLLTFIAINYDIKASIHSRRTELIALIGIYLLGVFSALFVINDQMFFTNLSLFTGALLAAYLVLALNNTYDFTLYFHIGFIASILILFIIMYIKGNIDLSNFATKIAYRNRFMLNANTYSYYSIFANFSLFYLYFKYRSKLLLFLLALLPVLFIVIAFTTQSRSGLLLTVVVNFCFWFFIHRPKNPNRLTKAAKFLVLIIAIGFFAIRFANIYQGSRIQGRVSSAASKTDSRTTLALHALTIFGENPALGVGLGQYPSYNDYGLFSHNSYTEVMAEHGILGIIFLLVLHFLPIYKGFRALIKNPENSILKCNLLFFITFALYNNFYVFYKFPFAMMYFFLIVAIQNQTLALLKEPAPKQIGNNQIN